MPATWADASRDQGLVGRVLGLEWEWLDHLASDRYASRSEFSEGTRGKAHGMVWRNLPE